MAISPDKKSIAVTVTKNTYERLQRIAAREKRSISFVANEYIEEGLKNDGNNR